MILDANQKALALVNRTLPEILSMRESALHPGVKNCLIPNCSGSTTGKIRRSLRESSLTGTGTVSRWL